MKSVTDCFKRGLALSAAALAPENCLALFPRATHLIKHARFSCSPDPSHLSFFHSASPLSHSHHRHEHAGPPSVYARVHTRTHVRFTFPFCFPFPSPSFLLVTLQHLSLILVPLSSFVVNESLYLPFFLPFFLCPLRFFSTSFSFARQIPRPLPIPSYSRLLPLLLLSLSDVLLPTRVNAIFLTRSLSTALSGGTPDRFGDSQINVSRTTCTDTSPLRLANSVSCTVQNFVSEALRSMFGDWLINCVI